MGLPYGDCTVSKLIFFMPMSLDGFIAGENDNLDWSTPNEEVYTLINDLHRPIGTYLYGRKNYETIDDLANARGHSRSDTGHDGLRAGLASGR